MTSKYEIAFDFDISFNFDTDKFSHTESDIFEFKESIVSKSFDKYLETICGFLNTKGGYLIFGIKDDLDLIGIKINQKNLDNFILRIDSIIGSSQIIGTDTITNEFVKLQSSNIKVNQMINLTGKKFLVIKIFSKPNIKYQLANGIIYHRLGASNYFEKTERIFKQADFDNVCKTIQKKAEQENKTNIDLFQKTLKEKNDYIELLNKKVQEEKRTSEIYKIHLETSLSFQNQNKIQKNINSSYNQLEQDRTNSNLQESNLINNPQSHTNTQLLQYNNYFNPINFYTSIVKTIFPCMK
jgi:hypothetical protein